MSAPRRKQGSCDKGRPSALERAKADATRRGGASKGRRLAVEPSYAYPVFERNGLALGRRSIHDTRYTFCGTFWPRFVLWIRVIATDFAARFCSAGSARPGGGRGP